MAGLVPAIHVPLRPRKDVDARVKPGHDDLICGARLRPHDLCVRGYRQCNSRVSSQPITLPTASPNTDRITTPASS
ncbi:hypothetical protein XH96_03750 [Bradyrhizobium sp. CCBAU 51765]|nr:hypothetical protein XH96_03750 [Bradyrhizobium sp. CCBAU 51765]